MIDREKESLKNQLYNNHWIADYSEEDPLVSLWFTDLTDLIEDYRTTMKVKFEKLEKLADAMYNAAFNMTTDASLLRKAMEEYHQFIIYMNKED